VNPDWSITFRTRQPCTKEFNDLTSRVLFITDPYAAYGLKVVGGKMTDDGKLGAFVTEIRKGGPADRQAQLQIGIYWITLCVAREPSLLYRDKCFTGKYTT